MDSLSPMVPRAEYDAAFHADVASCPYDPARHCGMRNPYTGTVIQNESDYLSYRAQYVYIRLSDQAAQSRTAAAHQQWVRRIFRRFLVFLLAAAILGGCWVSSALRSSFSNGQAAGYADGYADGQRHGIVAGTRRGYESGVSDGRRSVSSPRVSPAPLPILPEQRQDCVYVSRNGKIHRSSICSGMRYYTEMTEEEALSSGYTPCGVCY